MPFRDSLLGPRDKLDALRSSGAALKVFRYADFIDDAVDDRLKDLYRGYSAEFGIDAVYLPQH